MPHGVPDMTSVTRCLRGFPPPLNNGVTGGLPETLEEIVECFRPPVHSFFDQLVSGGLHSEGVIPVGFGSGRSENGLGSGVPLKHDADLSFLDLSSPWALVAEEPHG